jgi:ferritin-like metal-binding protein YciE
MSSPEHDYVAWLRDAHAMEQQAISMLETEIERFEDYPALRERLREHLEVTRRQLERLEGGVTRHHGERSTLKDVAGRLIGKMQAISGLFVADEPVKGIIALYTFEHYESACYRVLAEAAERAGDPEVVKVCRESLAEEEAMAAWLGDHLAEVTRDFLARRAAEEPAAR